MIRKNWLALLVIVVIVVIFFARLFFPEPKLFYTTESLGSDLWSFFYPNKDFLAQSLKQGQLPFWSKDVGGGLPLFAEGQIAAFYFPNTFLFYLFPTWLAWNLSYVLAFLLAFLGSFLFFRKIGISSWASLFSSFSFSFGGYFISRVIHTSPLQTISLMPWLFLAGDYFWEKPSKWRALFLAMVLAQQIFTGGFQWVFISLFGFFIYSIAQFREKNSRDLLKKVGLFGLVVLFAFSLAAPQLLPTWELRQLSKRRSGLSQEEIFCFPYSFKDLVTFVSPDFFGTPKNASYLVPSGLYWENTAYLGILPLIFLVLALFKRRKRSWEWSFWILGAFSLLLVPGQASPLYFILTLPGFNNFRVPSRFLLLVTFSIAGLAGAGLDWLLDALSGRRKDRIIESVLPVVIFAVSVFDLTRFALAYHPLVPVDVALAPPEVVEGIGEGERIYTHPEQVRVWKEAFYKGGWQDTTPFIYFKNGLYADLTMVFGRTNIGSASDFLSERAFAQKSLLSDLLNAAAVSYIISPSLLNGEENLELEHTVEPPRADLPSYYVYKNLGSLGRFRFVSSYVVGGSLDEVVDVIKTGEFAFDESVILESDPGESFEKLSRGEIEVLLDHDQRLVLHTDTDKKAVLLVADSYYPDWRASINGREAQILPANINQRALIVPAGENRIEFVYHPRTFYRGLVISAVTLTVFMLVVVFRLERLLFGISKEKLGRGRKNIRG